MSSVSTVNFLSCPAALELEELAKDPLYLPELFSELKNSGGISAYIRQCQSEACGITLSYCCEKITEAVLKVLQNFAEQRELQSKMQDMFCGKEINKIEGQVSENRAVLHAAMRDIFDDGALEGDLYTSAETREAIDKARVEWNKVRSFLSKNPRFEEMIVIGIGGSDLGPRAIYTALEAFKQKSLRFISNVDPDDAAKQLEGKDLSKTLVAVISKSGTTIETETNEAIVRQLFEQQNLDTKKHFVAITGQGSAMDDHSRYLETFYIWDYVGGRYSVSSMVGVLPLAFALGMEHVEAFLKGARDMDRASFEADIKKNPAILSALIGIWNQNFLGAQTKAILAYAQPLERFAAHIQQLEMESNGKSITTTAQKVDYQTGYVVWGEPGTNGQHSFYQHIHQGSQEKMMIEFIGFKENQRGLDAEFRDSTSREKLNANLFAQAVSLAEGKEDANPNKNFAGNQQSQMLFAKRLDPYTMGALLSFYENQVVAQGFLWGINSFDQEGVQLGKVNANECLSQIVAMRKDQTVPDSSVYKAFIEMMRR